MGNDLQPSFAITALSQSATRADNDLDLFISWIRSLGSEHTQTCFRKTAADFVDALIDLGVDLRSATVEDVRDAIEAITTGRSASTAKQYVLRVKSLLSYGHKLGYTRFNAGTTIKVRSGGQDSGELAKLIISEVEVGLLIRAASVGRNRIMLQVAYGGGLRVSELCGIKWGDVILRDELVQLCVTGKGGRIRQVLLPEALSKQLLALRGDAGANDSVFQTRSGRPLTPRGVHAIVKRIAKTAGITGAVRPTGCGTPTPATPSITAPPWPKCKPPSDTPVSARQAPICTPGRKALPASSWMRGSSMSEIVDAATLRQIFPTDFSTMPDAVTVEIGRRDRPH